jgi:hypothetical protein
MIFQQAPIFPHRAFARTDYEREIAGSSSSSRAFGYPLDADTIRNCSRVIDVEFSLA